MRNSLEEDACFVWKAQNIGCLKKLPEKVCDAIMDFGDALIPQQGDVFDGFETRNQRLFYFLD